MPYIIGTAGHIDHGKTSLIKALTGEDTDRLKEEKERGISIDLGFAEMRLPDGAHAGVVDVPGHERFIRNMLAGSHGIDLALFTVAADDGIMPQTEEHLDILYLLGIERAIFVLTKIDLASEARVREVDDDIRILTAGTPFEGSPIIPFSSVTGQGLEQIRTTAAAMLAGHRKPAPPGYFRLPVDRVFALPGHGLIVTGTARSGEVRVGDRVRRLPGDDLFRVRSIQVHNEAQASATWGERVALNLSGQESSSLARGDVICHEKITRTTDRFDAVLQVGPAAVRGVKNHQRVRVHLGTAERLAKLILLGGRENVDKKESAYCQIHAEEAVLALRGDRFVIRDETSRRTLGGGVVIHPWPPKHKRKEAGLVGKLERLHTGDIPALVDVLIEESDELALPIAAVHQFLNVKEDEAEARMRAMPEVRTLAFEGETLYTTRTKWKRMEDALREGLGRRHAAQPLSPGMDMEEARASLPHQTTPRVFRAFVGQLEASGSVVREGNLLRLPEHTVQVRGEERTIIEKIQSILDENPGAPPETKHIQEQIGAPRARLLEVLRVMEREQSIVRVSPDFYFSAAYIRRVVETLHAHTFENGEITPARFRDLFGTTRKYAIPLLEYLDRENITIRIGETRRLKGRRESGR